MSTQPILSRALPAVSVPAARLAEPCVKSTLIRGALGSLLVQVAGIGATFGSQVGLAHLLGSGAFGQYAYIVAWVGFLAIAGRFGLDFSSLRFIPEYRARGEMELLRGFVRHSALVAATVPAVMAIVGVGLSFAYAHWVAPDTLVPTLLGLALFTVLSLQGLFTAQLRALKRVVLGQLPKQLLSPIAVVTVTFAVVYFTGQKAGATTALTVAVLANLCLTVLAGVMAYRPLRAEYGDVEPQYDARLWRSTSLAMLLVGAVQVINLRVDVLMVGALRGMQDAGIYIAASQVAGLSLLGLLGVNAIAAPMISELYAKGRTDEFQRFLTLAAWGIFLVTLPIAVGLIVMGTWLLGLFGHEFVVGYPALVTLVIGQAANALIGPVGFLALMTGNQREATWIFGTGAMLNVILNLILIPTFGLIGAAAATAIANGVWKLSMMVFVWKRLQVNPTVFPSRTARS